MLEDLEARVIRAIVEFDMIADGDRLLVGLSGGKDSSFLLYILSKIRSKLPFHNELAAINIDQGFNSTENTLGMKKLCKKLGIRLFIEDRNIVDILSKEKNPCAKCAYFRRAVMAEIANKEGFNTIVLGHNKNDAIETFLMNQVYSGKLQCMAPQMYMDRSGIKVVRPLIYIWEDEILTGCSLVGIKVHASKCLFQGDTKRAKIRQVLK